MQIRPKPILESKQLSLQTNHKLELAAFVTILTIIIIFGTIHAHKRRILMENGIKEAQEESAKYTAIKKAEEQAKADEEMKKYEALPSEVKARIAFGRVIEAAFQAEGRRMSVHASGEKFDTLEISSVLIFEGSHTLDAAQGIFGSDTMQRMKKLKFKRIQISGSRYSQSYPLR